MKTILQNIIQLSIPAKIFAMLFAFLLPLQTITYWIIFLLVSDAVISIYKQFKDALIDARTKSQQKPSKYRTLLRIIDPDKLKKTLEKMVFYVIMIIIIFVFELIVLQLEHHPDKLLQGSITNIAAGMISFVEITSISKKITQITNNAIFERLAELLKPKK